MSNEFSIGKQALQKRLKPVSKLSYYIEYTGHVNERLVCSEVAVVTGRNPAEVRQPGDGSLDGPAGACIVAVPGHPAAKASSGPMPGAGQEAAIYAGLERLTEATIGCEWLREPWIRFAVSTAR
ncbi:MAG TPA: hypothetical protein VJZ71_16555 [Phycisphaerae bacterium]|nr:hypothetical protein [Phycisphaerae bacterium]